MKKSLMVVIVIGVFLGLSSVASAIPIVIDNPSFEDLKLAEGQYDSTITGWSGKTFGVINPSDSMMSASQASEGLNAAWSNGGIFGQWLGVDPLLNSRYTLSVDVGYRLDLLGSYGPSQDYELRFVRENSPGYEILAYATGTTPTAGTWGTAELIYDALSVEVGQLGIQLVAKGIQVLFDNVRLDESPLPQTNPVPEPATMLLLGSGLVGLAAARRRKFSKK